MTTTGKRSIFTNEELVDTVLKLSTTNKTGDKLFVLKGKDPNAIAQYIWTLFKNKTLEGCVTTVDHILFERYEKDNLWASLFEYSTVNIIFLSEYADLNRHKDKLIALVEGKPIAYKKEGSTDLKYGIPKATQIFVTNSFQEKDEVDEDLREKMCFIPTGINYIVPEIQALI